MDRCTEPGAVNLITGDRKSGKSFTAVSMMQPVVEGRIKELPKTFMLTNMVFVHAGTEGRAMPPGVTYVESVEGLFRTMLSIYEEHGTGIRMVLVMDEAQTHMMADKNHDPVNQAMLQILSLIRKFNLAVFFLSPTRMNLAPRIRNFIDDPKTPGNMNYLWYKDLPRIRAYIKERKLPYKANQFTTWQPSESVPSAILYVPTTSWTTKVGDLKKGYAYDDEAAATFRYKDTDVFDHKDLIDACSGVRKDGIPGALRDYFDGLDSGTAALSPKDAAKAEQIDRIRRMRELKPPIKWADIAIIEGLSEGAVKMKLKRAGESVFEKV
jgi:hypothetical protein